MNSYRTENYIKDKVIVITGASSGFGKETAKKAAELGGKVVLAARREELLREITQEKRRRGFLHQDRCSCERSGQCHGEVRRGHLRTH